MRKIKYLNFGLSYLNIKSHIKIFGFAFRIRKIKLKKNFVLKIGLNSCIENLVVEKFRIKKIGLNFFVFKNFLLEKFQYQKN